MEKSLEILHCFPNLISRDGNRGPQEPDVSVHSCTAVSLSLQSSLSGNDATADTMSGSPGYIQCCWVLGNFMTFNRQFSWINSIVFIFFLCKVILPLNEAKFVVNKNGRNSIKIIFIQGCKSYVRISYKAPSVAYANAIPPGNLSTHWQPS